MCDYILWSLAFHSSRIRKGHDLNMEEIQLGIIEAKYADMIWEHEPVSSSELVKMTAVEFNWKRTTAHNVLRRLIDKGLFQNEN